MRIDDLLARAVEAALLLLLALTLTLLLDGLVREPTTPPVDDSGPVSITERR